MDRMYLDCLEKAEFLVTGGYPVGKIGVADLTDLLYKLEMEKIDKQAKSDANLNYNETIVAVEEVGEMETVDISVSGDNLFYCNGILTKNSFGLPATADLMLALITSEELEKLNQIMIKQLKNRYSDISTHRRFVVGVDRSRMKLYDVEDSAQNLIDLDDTPVMDKTPAGQQDFKDKLKGFK